VACIIDWSADRVQRLPSAPFLLPLMAHPKVDSGRSVTVEARRKTVEGFAHQFFDEQLTRSPFCIPERNGERWKQLSHSLNAIRKGLVCTLNLAKFPHN